MIPFTYEGWLLNNDAFFVNRYWIEYVNGRKRSVLRTGFVNGPHACLYNVLMMFSSVKKSYMVERIFPCTFPEVGVFSYYSKVDMIRVLLS